MIKKQVSTIEPIKDSLNKINIPSFEQKYNELKNRVLTHPSVKQFMNDHNMTENSAVIQYGMTTLFEFVEQKHTCCGADSTSQCQNFYKGHVPQLMLSNGQINIIYRKCEQMIKEDDQRELASMMKTMYMPKDVLKADFNEMDMNDNSRMAATQFMVEFRKQYRETKELPAKGLYLYGTFGVGKTYILGAIANALSKERIQTLLVYMPEFIRELKSAVTEGSIEQKIDFVKKVPVLMLDDVGSEPISTWTRDEIIGSILHYRMAEKLPTFISSNFNYKQLEEQWSVTEHGAIDEMKSGRILQRVQALTTPLEITGTNRRK